MGLIGLIGPIWPVEQFTIAAEVAASAGVPEQGDDIFFCILFKISKILL